MRIFIIINGNILNFTIISRTRFTFIDKRRTTVYAYTNTGTGWPENQLIIKPAFLIMTPCNLIKNYKRQNKIRNE